MGRKEWGDLRKTVCALGLQGGQDGAASEPV